MKLGDNWMITFIAICLFLITVALIFGSDAAQDLLGCLFKIILWGVIITIGVGVFVVVFS